MNKYLELAMLLVAILAPWYMMAAKIDTDEIQKTMASVGATAVVGGYAVWKRKDGK